jgi:GT2 family glycosyltransferase
MAVRRQIILKLGGFDEALDMGGPLPGGGDLDILWRAIDNGYEVMYEPSVEALHEHRSDYRDSANQIIDHNRSLVAMLTKIVAYGCNTGRISVALFLIWRLIKPGVRILSRLAGRDPLPAVVLLRLWWNCWRGLYSYTFARRLAVKRRIVSYD